MGSKKVKLFVQAGCPRCPAAKNLAENVKKDVNINIFDTQTPEGLAEASYYQIMSTPAFIVLNDKDEVLNYFPKTPTKNELFEAIK